jgi:hypothetical protein
MSICYYYCHYHSDFVRRQFQAAPNVPTTCARVLNPECGGKEACGSRLEHAGQFRIILPRAGKDEHENGGKWTSKLRGDSPNAGLGMPRLGKVEVRLHSGPGNQGRRDSITTWMRGVWKLMIGSWKET